jgi:hypothetical protein
VWDARSPWRARQENRRWRRPGRVRHGHWPRLGSGPGWASARAHDRAEAGVGQGRVGVRRNPGSNARLPALGLKEEWPAGRGDAGDARGVKGPYPDFG